MSRPARARIVLGVALAAVVAAFGLAGCSGGLGGTSSDEFTDMSWESQALQAIGFTSQDLAATGQNLATAEPQASGKDRRAGDRRFKRLRFAFGHGVLHGEAVVQTDEGTKTVVVQRGTVTAIDSSSITVKSSDGFSLTWKFGDPMHVIQNRQRIQASAVAVGATVGVAGVREGDSVLARLIVIPGAKR